jgi:MFS family permease
MNPSPIGLLSGPALEYQALYSDSPRDRTKAAMNGQPLAIHRLFLLCAALFGWSSASSVEYSLENIFLGTLNLPQWASGLIWSIVPLSSAATQVLVGFYSDGSQSKWGRRPFILAGCIAAFVGFGIEWVTQIPGLRDRNKTKIAVFVIGSFIANVSINISRVASRALIIDIAPHSQQLAVNIIGTIMMAFGMILLNLIGCIHFLDQKQHYTVSNDTFTFLLSGFFFLSGVVVTVATTKEEAQTQAIQRGSPVTELGIALRSMPRPLLKISVVYLLSVMAYTPFQIILTTFFIDELFPEGKADPAGRWSMLVFVAVGAVALLFCLVQVPVFRKIGVRLSIGASQVLEAVALAACLLPIYKDGKEDRPIGFVLLFGTIGMAWASFNLLPFAIIALLIPPEQTGLFLGVVNLFAVVGQWAATLLSDIAVRVIWPTSYRPVIASGSVYALASAVMCFWIPVPALITNFLTGMREPDTLQN